MTLVASGVNALSQSGGVTNFASGYYTGDGTQGAIAVNIGFTPRYVKLMNLTDLLFYEYFEGMDAALADTDVDDTLLTTGSTGAVTNDDNNAIQTNASVVTSTQVAFPAPGAQSPDDGVNGTTTVTTVATDKSKPRLQFNAGSSGAITNVNSKVYLWMAFG